MRKRRLFGILIALIVLAAVSLSLVPRAEAATVSRIVDGDTLIANIDGREETIRLLNIDTPETKHPSKNKQCLGDEAAEWLAARLPPGTSIDLEFDEQKNDRYGRLLAAVYEDDSLVNAEIALTGLGVPVTFGSNSKFRQNVQDAYEKAKAASRGLFDPQVDCTMQAKMDTIENLVEDLPEVPADGDPSPVLEDMTVIIEDLQTMVEELDPNMLGVTGLAIFDAPALDTYYSEIQATVKKIEGKADLRAAELRTAKNEWDDEQERLRKEQEEREAKERAEAEKKAQVERERLQEAQHQREAQQQPQPKTSSRTPVPVQQQPTRPKAQNPAPQPPAPPAPAPKKKSSCSPYGPEISYSNDGGYTGLRYGMPGGKTFRKCS